MESNVFDKVREVDLRKAMEQSYIDYVMGVISARALPNVRGGPEPVQRRVLCSMIELNNGPDKPHRKCAHIVGSTVGRYHPHGDSSTYEALANMAQEQSTRYPLVSGYGDPGSVGGDGVAAMYYTEAHSGKTPMEILADINRDTVDFIPNFDETEKELSVLPSRYSNLLVNDTSGTAVGMATNIPPYNLKEVIGVVVKMIDNRVEEDRETSLEGVTEIIKEPDFPTGATILGRRGIEEAYHTRHTKIKIRAATNIETMANGKSRIIAVELPYMVDKAHLIGKIADLVKGRKIDGITYTGDESNREGIRINMELRRDVNANAILDQLLKHTQLQDAFGVIMLALINNQPKVPSPRQMLEEYLKHQEGVVIRRTQYNLNKAEEKTRILKGLLIVLDNIDEVIRIIRGVTSMADVKSQLVERFGLSGAQSQAIVDMGLRALTGLEREKLEDEYRELQTRIEELKAVLADEKKLLTVIWNEITIISDKYGDDRRTAIGHDDDMFTEDLIPSEGTIIAMTHLSYIKRMDVDDFKNQSRGGEGIKGMQTIEEDCIEDLLMITNHHYMMFFANTGRAYRLKAYEISEVGHTARETAVINLLRLMPEERITAIIPVRESNGDKYLFMTTRNDMVEEASMVEYECVRKDGLQTVILRDGDKPIEAKATDNNQDILLAAHKGMYIRFNETDVRVAGRVSMGVIGTRFKDDDEAVGVQMQSQGDSLLVVSENGMGKRTMITEFNAQNRSERGATYCKCTDKAGYLVGAKLVDDGREVVIITTEGIITCMTVDDTSVIERNISGVKLMSIDQDSDVKAASTARARESVTKDGNVYDEEYYGEKNGDPEEENEANVDSGEAA